MFLEKFFLASRTILIKKKICGIKKHIGETLYEFNKLCVTCPHHQISKQLLVQSFYEGLMLMYISMINVASGGVLMAKTLTAARNLIFNMSSNTQQFGGRGSTASKVVNERLDNTTLVHQLEWVIFVPFVEVATMMGGQQFRQLHD
ncbi:hypothetical protein CR513_50381, partial [Mucuna pruriens]